MADLPVLGAPEALTLRLGEVGAGRRLGLRADATARKAVAERLGLVDLEAFEGEADVSPWFDGVEVRAVWRARVVQTCGVSLEAFPADLEGAFEVRLVPEGSPNAPPPTPEVILDPEADDPPEVLEGPEIALGALFVEHLALEIDPFPRRPGVVFEPPAADPLISPFAVLRRPPQ
jgi:hypothetical protein